MIRRLPQLLFVVFAALLACQAGAAPIVDVAAVKAAQARGAIVWDVRATPPYRKGHIPGALSIGDAGNVLETMGFDKVKVYDASWLGYTSRLDAPVERESFFNVGAMNGRLASMQRKIDELERMIGELHSRHAKNACAAGKVC